MSNSQSGGAAAPVVREPIVTAQEGDTNEQHEQPQHEREGVPHPGEPTETVKGDSRTPKNAMAAGGISADAHAPPNSAAAPPRPSDRRSAPEDQHASKKQQRQSTDRGERVSAPDTTPPASTVSSAANPAAGDAASPYRAVYQGEDNWGAAGTGEEAAFRQGSEQEGNAFSDTLNSLRGLASRARQSVVRVARGDFTDFRRAGESIHRVGTGDFSELAGIERYLCSLFEECTALSEKLCPCVIPEVRRSPVGRAPAGPPPIMMLVDTPGGPYMRSIPDALVEESVRQGLLSAADVERQRQEAAYTAVPP